MARTVFLLLSGIALGGVAVWMLAGPDDGTARAPAAAADRVAVAITTNTRPATDIPVVTTVAGAQLSQRVQVYERAAAATNSFELESMIDLAMRQPVSFARDLEIRTLLARLAELDPRAAVEFAESRYLDADFLEPVFEAWARADAGAAIARAAATVDPATRRRLALALLRVVGFDADGIARVAAALPELEQAVFRFDAISAQAEIDAFGALRAALDLNRTSMQQSVLLDIAQAAARQDPRGALVRADAIDNVDLRRAFLGRVLATWAETDPEAVFALIESSGSEYGDVANATFNALADADAERLLALAELLPTTLKSSAQQAVLMQVAETDPMSAIAQTAELMPPGQERDGTIQSIAQLFGRDDPDAALAWANALSPPSQDALVAVLRGVMQVDFDRAIDAIVAEAEKSSGPGTPFASPFGFTLLFFTMPGGDADNYARFADRLIEVDQSNAVRNMFGNVLSRWSAQDAEGALSWALANADRIDSGAFRSLASQAARNDPDRAIQMLNSLPANQRQGWVTGVAQGLAQFDLDRAIDFVGQYRGQPAFDDALMNIVSAGARADPARIARLLDEAGNSQNAASAAQMLASGWAQTDPRAAAAWAATLDNRRTQTMATQMIARSWATSDADAARSWLFGMANGEARDAAIDGYLGAMAGLGSFDERMLQAYSSDAARERGASNVIVQIGRNDVDEARRLLDVYISDPAVRQQTETMLAQTGGAGNGGIISSGGLVFIN